MNKIRILMLVLLFCLCQSQGQTVVNDHVKEYIVHAKGVETLMADMNKSSPIEENGNKYHGHTESFVKWNFWYNKDSGACKINQVIVTLDTYYIFPKLDKSAATDKVVAIWNKYYPALITHEKGHGEISLGTANEIKTLLLNMPAQSNCTILGEKANQAAKKMWADGQSKHVDYDQRTQHGTTQGANLNIYLKAQ